MALRLVNMRLPEELLDRVDARRVVLGQTRTKFVQRALEQALAGGVASEPRSATVGGAKGSAGESPIAADAPSSAPARTSGSPSPSLRRFMNE